MADGDGKNIKVRFEGKRCIHARRCVTTLPDVFVAGADGDWMFPDKGSAEDVAAVVQTCPSGALTFERIDGGEAERPAQVNTARMWENGPGEYRGDIQIEGEDPRLRATLCRCGASKRKPYCDKSHAKVGFKATGDMPTDEADSEFLTARDGPLKIKPLHNGPLMVEGNLEILAGCSGRRVATIQKAIMCRCGHSQNKPFCDGSHIKYGFKAD